MKGDQSFLPVTVSETTQQAQSTHTPVEGLKASVSDDRNVPPTEESLQTTAFTAAAKMWRTTTSTTSSTASFLDQPISHESISNIMLSPIQPASNDPHALNSTMFEITPQAGQPQRDAMDGKVPSDLLYGWGPEESTVKATIESTPRIMPAGSTAGIGWDDDDTQPALSSKNEWDPEFAFKKIPSPGYAVFARGRSPSNVSLVYFQ